MQRKLLPLVLGIIAAIALLAFALPVNANAASLPSSSSIQATASTSAIQPGIPPQLITYVEQHNGTNGCVSGTLNPFTITSTVCYVPPGLASQGFTISPLPGISHPSDQILRFSKMMAF